MSSTIPGCYEIKAVVTQDIRGSFVKTFHEEAFADHNLCTRFSEGFYTVSKRDVLRGMHFQVPPHDHTKLVYCTSGNVMDVVIDLRLGSPTYGRFQCFELSPVKANMVYIPRGLAHGFYVLSGSATLNYKASTVYSSAHDRGIRWDSLDIPWPTKTPIISDRDQNFLPLSKFESPFRFGKEFRQ